MNPDDIWRKVLAGTEIANQRPDFRSNPDFLQNRLPMAFSERQSWRQHFWKLAGRRVVSSVGLRNAHQHYNQMGLDLQRVLLELVRDPDLRALMAAGHEDAFELAFELIALGHPIDRQISNFSDAHYLECYPEVGEAGMKGFHHYVQHGHKEGRRTLAGLRGNQIAGAQVFDASKPTCIICIHEGSRTGAPIVGLELTQAAAETHNVIVMALRDGVLLKEFHPYCLATLVSTDPDVDLPYALLPELEKVEFAILNSVESFPFIKYFVRMGIPFASYVHEFSDYTYPAYKRILTTLFSDLLVFSSNPVRDSWQPGFCDLNFDMARDSIIVPQAELHQGQVTQSEYLAARAHITRLLGIDLKGRKIVYGAGVMDWRKGTDLFVLAAQQAAIQDPDTLYLWVGDGQNHEDYHFGIWFDKHLREAGANRADGNLFVMPAGPHYRDICQASDVFFLSSRLDPLPNVVFDAMDAGCQVVVFKGASGFDDTQYAQATSLQIVAYGDISGAIAAARAAPLKQALPDLTTPEPSSDISNQQAKAGVFSRIHKALQHQIATPRIKMDGAGEYDVSIIFSDIPTDLDVRIKEREKIWSYQRHYVWPSLENVRQSLVSADNWVYKRTEVTPFSRLDSDAALPEYSVHIHAYYTDILADDLARYPALSGAKRLIITTDTSGKADTIGKICDQAKIKADIRIVENQGRDILPFLRLFSDASDAIDTEPDDIWCHIHQKKSVGTMTSGALWHRFLLDILLGDKQGLSSALQQIARPDIGLVAPFDPYMLDWNASRRLLPELESKQPAIFPAPLPEHAVLFPVGNMFWTRTKVVTQMNQVFGQDYPWPNEPLANDGTVYHLIERLWPAACAMTDLAAIFVEKQDQKRG